jgi:protocatechuate 3,4-dioxygenase, beta subunit
MTYPIRRRDLLRGALAGAGLLALAPLRAARAQPHDMDPPRGRALEWRARLAPAGEPGEPLILQGTLYAPDGRTPARGVTLYAYHTDATGLYSATPGGLPRLRGWMVTDAAGRYELRSIRPAAYPGRSIPAHIHFNAWGAGYPRQWFEQLEFEGDALVTAERADQSRRLGRFGNVQPITRGADHIWRCRTDMRLRERSNY